MSTRDEDRVDSEDQPSEKSSEPEGASTESSSEAPSERAKAATSSRPEAATSSRPKAATSSRPKAAASAQGASGKAGANPARLALGAIAILALGGAGGWFAHEAHAKSELQKEAAAGGEDGACGAWEQQICESSGQESPGCQQAKSATDLMTPSTCEAALETVPATLSKMKAARASCDKLVGKLCKDLSAESPACDFVKEQTPAFPPSRCEAMLGQYDKVLQELQMLEQQMQRRGGGPMGMPPGADPHANPHAPPGANPHAPPGSNPHAPPGAVVPAR